VVWVRVETILAHTNVPVCARWVSMVSAVAAWTSTNAHVTPVHRANSAEIRVVATHAHATVAIWKEVMVAVMISMNVQSTMELAPTHVPTIKADTHADVKIEHSKLAIVIASVRQMVSSSLFRTTHPVTNEVGSLAQLIAIHQRADRADIFATDAVTKSAHVVNSARVVVDSVNSANDARQANYTH